jgi:radical SAM protein (TIGR01212 family)
MRAGSYLLHEWCGKRYNSFNRVLKETFRSRVYKVSLRADFTCPNRDGKVAVGGCIYCNNAGHTPEGYRPVLSIRQQMEQGTAAQKRRHRAEKFIAYFQSYTNTYGAVAKLERLYREALDFPDVVGLSVGTRPDCVPDEVLDLLADIARDTYVWLELGLESMQEKTLRWINRGHGLGDFTDAVERLKTRGLRVCAHVILGFPTETRAEMLQTPHLLNALKIDGIKLHNLHVIENTRLAELYRSGSFSLQSRDEYVSLAADFLELLDPEMIVHRITGETYRQITVAPAWSIDKISLMNAIHRELDLRNTWQGRLYGGRPVRQAPMAIFAEAGSA